MQVSPLVVKARAIMEAAQGKQLTIEERTHSSVELASLMLKEANLRQTKGEKELQSTLARMMNDPKGKIFTVCMADQCFRSDKASRVADQLTYLINKFGIPHFLSSSKRLRLKIFKLLGKSFSSIMVPLAKGMIRKQTASVILSGELAPLEKHIQKRKKQGIRVNLNHLGEAILGEEEANKRLQTYLEDLKNPEIEYISVKISTICSQITLLAWQDTLERIAVGLRQLYRAAESHRFKRGDGCVFPKFVNLDMEEYRELHLTVEVFKKVLEEPEFFSHSAGIVLQSYLPDSFPIQQNLTEWAMKRVQMGGAPIKIRIVKGANLAMEQVEASIKEWPQAPYTTKCEVDANFKRMVNYGCIFDHAKAANLGIGSHNLLDISYGLIIRAENGVEKQVCFEMLEGMAEPIRRVVQELSGDMLLYCPIATKEEFKNAIAYLIRRLDENTAPENFLRHSFNLVPGKKEWKFQVKSFSESIQKMNEVSSVPRRNQNRLNIEKAPNANSDFKNEPDTDWSLGNNRKWIESIIQRWKNKIEIEVPLVIAGKEFGINSGTFQIGNDPSIPKKVLYRFRIAEAEITQAIETAKHNEKKWGEESVQERSKILAKVAQKIRERRGELIAAMVADGGKTVVEADTEVSEAIDFVEYYRRTAEEWMALTDVEWSPKGTALVAPPWNFPCSIPLGGIIAALATGNCVIFKPAIETVLVGWELVKIIWEAGISKEVLQFVPCLDDPYGSLLIKDPGINVVVLTGATNTAKFFLKLRPGLDLVAETGGKNALIVTALADRDLAVKDLIHSAFSHSGQKCSACSLAILEDEVYDDPHFRKQLKDAAKSLKIGSAWDFESRINPLISPPHEILKKSLTTLEWGEEWLLEPQQDPYNPNLWSPGIKLGVKEGSFTHQTELFGPVLGIMRADNLSQAIQMANGTPYGLTSGLHSLDERERQLWMSKIESGNCYVNRTITGAVVRRQPFGGCKDSSFGRGMKAGGPNYIIQMMNPRQVQLPTLKEKTNAWVTYLDSFIEHGYSNEEKSLWEASVGNYAFFWNHYFSRDHDPSLLQGQDNLFRYVPQELVLRVQEGDSALDILRVCAAALTCGATLSISATYEQFEMISYNNWSKKLTQIQGIFESEEEFIKRILQSERMRLRLLQTSSRSLMQATAEAACRLFIGKVLANGRLELLNHLSEVSFSIDYHRYGNLGSREGEIRTPICGSQTSSKSKKCKATCACHR